MAATARSPLRRHARTAVLPSALVLLAVAVMPWPASADVLPRAHLAIDGLSLSLDEAARDGGVVGHDGVDTLGLRLRAGMEVGGYRAGGYRFKGRDGHRSRDRSRRDQRRGPPLPPLLGPRLGVELHAAWTGGDVVGGGASWGERVEASLFGGYLTGRLPLGPYVSFKGLAGLSTVSVERPGDTYRWRNAQAGFGFGLGLEAALGRYTDLTVDWMRYLAEDDPSYDDYGRIAGLAVGLKVSF